MTTEDNYNAQDRTIAQLIAQGHTETYAKGLAMRQEESYVEARAKARFIAGGYTEEDYNEVYAKGLAMRQENAAVKKEFSEELRMLSTPARFR